MNFLIWLFFSLVLYFVSQSHPFFVSLILVALSINIVGLMSSASEHWLNFIFVLVYLGGILIIFVYTSSSLPNIRFYKSKPNLFWLSFLFIIVSTFNQSLCMAEKSPSLIISMVVMEWLPLLAFFSFLIVILITSTEFAWQKSSPMKSI